MSDMANQVIYTKRFLQSIGYTQQEATIYQDNQSAITLITKGKSESLRTKHIQIRYFWLNEQIKLKVIKIIHIPTEKMGSANVLTKAVTGSHFRMERSMETKWQVSSDQRFNQDKS